MELSEQITALEVEKKQYILHSENLNAEKTALDQMLVESLKSGLEAKKQVLMKDNAINDLSKQVQALLQEKESLKSSLQALQSDAQSGC